MSINDIALFLHVVGALGLFIALGIEWLALSKLRQGRTIEEARLWSGVSESLPPLFGMSTLLILVPGIYLVLTAGRFGTGWVDISLVLTVVLAILGPALNGRRAKVIAQSIPAGSGPLPLDVQAKALDPVLWTSVQTMSIIALGIVFLMTVKPGFPGSLLTFVVTVVIGLAVSAGAWRNRAAGQQQA